MRPPLRIAVLECDTPLDETRHKYGGYGGVFEALLRAGADALGQPKLISSEKGLDISKWDVVDAQQYPRLEDVDAVLITGSRFNSFDDNPWILKLVEFMHVVLAQDRVRAIGVCYGHQIIARAMGTKVGRSDKGWEASVTEVKMTQKGKELFEKDILSIHQMHQDIVYSYPSGTEHLGSSPRCEVQGMYVKGHIITVQGHPEFNEQIVTELLQTRHKQGVFDDTMYQDAMSRVAKKHDGVAVGRAFIKFLLEE